MKMTDFIENFYTDRNQFDYEDPDTQKIGKAAIGSVLPLILKNDLTERQQACLNLKYIQGLSQSEIATKLNLSQPTVSRHIYCAKQIINNRLSYCLFAIDKTNKLWIELENSYTA